MRINTSIASFAVVLSIMSAMPAQAQVPTSVDLKEILQELRQIRALLEKNIDKPISALESANVPTVPPTRNTTLDVGNSPMLGSETAPITMVEFTDFQCPYCNSFYEQTFPRLKKDYIDSGRVRFYSMNLPLAVHPNALRAAQAGQCASDQGAFWKMFDMMQTNPQQLEMSNLITYAKKIGLDISAFRECVESRKYEDRIQGAARDAERMGARGTPAFVIGKSTPNGVDGSLFIGAQDYSFFDKILKAVQ